MALCMNKTFLFFVVFGIMFISNFALLYVFFSQYQNINNNNKYKAGFIKKKKEVNYNNIYINQCTLCIGVSKAYNSASQDSFLWIILP